jgi:hypothetical protein
VSIRERNCEHWAIDFDELLHTGWQRRPWRSRGKWPKQRCIFVSRVTEKSVDHFVTEQGSDKKRGRSVGVGFRWDRVVQHSPTSKASRVFVQSGKCSSTEDLQAPAK